MSSNLERLCQVDIEISRPVSNNASFDAILIIGPAPKSGAVVKPVVPYSSLTEATDAGYVATGDNADPVGSAIRVAFSQSPKPSVVYVATRQLSAKAVAAATAISDVNDIIKGHVGVKKDLTGCSLAYSEKSRKLSVALDGPVSGVKNTGLIEALTALVENGYIVRIDGNEAKSLAELKKTPAFKAVAAMTIGVDPVTLQVVVGREGVPDITYAVNVSYPDPSAPVTASDIEEGPIDSPDTELESVSETLSRALETDGWYTVCPAGIEDGRFEEIAQWIETQDKMFGYTYMGANPVPLIYMRSFGFYGREYVGQPDDEIPDENNYLHIAACAKILRYDPGSETWAHKVLAAVNPSKLTTGQANDIIKENGNYFITVSGLNITMNGKTCGGEWIDLIRFRDWLKNDMQVRVVNLMTARKKIPYTNGGISLVENQMISSLKAGRNAGGIAEVEYDSFGNEIPSFTTSVPNAADLTPTQKASRKLQNVSFSARIAGAIHMVEISGNLTYENL